MSREKTCENCLHHFACKVNNEYVPTLCRAYEDKAEYRKQSEGEWKNGITGCICCVCGEQEQRKFKFCPNCGAKMKGGAE